MKDINPDSEEVLRNAVVEENLKDIVAKSPMNIEIPGSAFNIKENKGNNTVRFQALRRLLLLGQRFKEDGLILNRIVSLKEDAAKNEQ